MEAVQTQTLQFQLAQYSLSAQGLAGVEQWWTCKSPAGVWLPQSSVAVEFWKQLVSLKLNILRLSEVAVPIRGASCRVGCTCSCRVWHPQRMHSTLQHGKMP